MQSLTDRWKAANTLAKVGVVSVSSVLGLLLGCCFCTFALAAISPDQASLQPTLILTSDNALQGATATGRSTSTARASNTPKPAQNQSLATQTNIPTPTVGANTSGQGAKTATSTPGNTSVPPTNTSVPPTTAPTNTSVPTNLPVPTAQVAVCNCSGDTLNCGDFATHNQAQNCYAYCWEQVGYDVHGLDGNDNDGQACESLP